MPDLHLERSSASETQREGEDRGRPPVHVEDLVPLDPLGVSHFDYTPLLLLGDASYMPGVSANDRRQWRSRGRRLVTELVSGSVVPLCRKYGLSYGEVLTAAEILTEAVLDSSAPRPTLAQRRILAEAERTIGLDAVDFVWIELHHTSGLSDTCAPVDSLGQVIAQTKRVFSDPYSTLNKLVRLCREVQSQA
ncbi:hypothetical protein KIPB_000173 [Kipferlia bialata]|uniref:Uncharacterized protein n=1 Tax=Kipferlia bialata TaxID=797122 RepID=A0A391NHY7_9EUKA|nr:hypothetical protein KIPB_000173 [Kipferlia bialata]|eukprot:g173.t1